MLVRSLLAVGLLIFGVWPSYAVTVFNFSFTNFLDGNGRSVVQGQITLPCDVGTCAATSVVIISNIDDGFGLGEYVQTPDYNSFEIAAGIITAMFFTSYYNGYTLHLEFYHLYYGNLCVGECAPGQGGSPMDLAAVPLPAALPLFASGVGVMGLLGWRRKRKKAVAVAPA